MKEYTLNNNFNALTLLVIVLLISNITFAEVETYSNNSQPCMQSGTNSYKEIDADYEGITFYEPMLSYEDIFGLNFIFDDERLEIQEQGNKDEQKN